MPVSVLIVDGNRWKRETFATALSYEGYQAEHTGDGAVALRLVARNSYELVLLDLSTPTTGGWKTVEQLVLLRPDLPVIVLVRAEEQRPAASISGAAAATALPTNVYALLRAMRRALSRPAETYVVRLMERKAGTSIPSVPEVVAA
jgi:DNA-binding response OmpR family regulator